MAVENTTCPEAVWLAPKCQPSKEAPLFSTKAPRFLAPRPPMRLPLDVSVREVWAVKIWTAGRDQVVINLRSLWLVASVERAGATRDFVAVDMKRATTLPRLFCGTNQWSTMVRARGALIFVAVDVFGVGALKSCASAWRCECP